MFEDCASSPGPGWCLPGVECEQEAVLSAVDLREARRLVEEALAAGRQVLDPRRQGIETSHTSRTLEAHERRALLRRPAARARAPVARGRPEHPVR